MDIREYKEMYQKMDMSAEMDQRIKNTVNNTREVKKRKMKNIYKVGIGVAAVLALFVCATQTDVVSAAVDRIIHYFSYSFTVENEDGTSEQVNMNTEYLSISKDAPKESCSLNSVKEAGKSMGLELLESSAAYKYDGCIEYSPQVSDDGQVMGAYISDHFYCVGDLKNVKYKKAESKDANDFITYDRGEKYRTPIMTQIAVRSDKKLSTEYNNREVGFVSESMNIDLTKDTKKYFDSELYTLDKLGIKAVLFGTRTDGPIAWGIESGEIECTVAVFVYQGVEYVYSGGVDHDTMEAFLDTLE